MKKKLFIFTLLIIFSLACSLGGILSLEEETGASPSILISIVMHNEEPKRGIYPDFLNDEQAFKEHRAALLEFVDMLKANDVMFNYQSDWNFLMAMKEYDYGSPETNRENILVYIEKLGFEIDPHAHESEYNYADVAYLIGTLGVIPSNTVGGFLALPPQKAKLEYLQEPIKASIAPNYLWQAEILWGGATMLHKDEESLWVSGVWQPKSNANFLEHDENTLPYIGGYGGDCEKLLKMQNNGELEEDKIHTCTVFVPQIKLLDPNFIAKIEENIHALDAAGDVRWVGLSEVIKIWEDDYDSQPNILGW